MRRGWSRMPDDGQELLKLYDAAMHAYHEFQAVANGDDLVAGQRVSPTKVAEAREVWTGLYTDLRLAEGYSQERINELLNARVAESETKAR